MVMSLTSFGRIGTQTNEQFSQELRLESQWNDSFKSIFGLYLWEREYEINQQTYFTPLFWFTTWSRVRGGKWL